MKTRQAFISNSSSASFILTLENASSEEIYNLLKENLWIDIPELEKKIKAKIKDIKAWMNKIQDPILEDLKATQKEQLSECEEMLTTDLDSLKALCFTEYCKVKEEFGNTKFCWNTSMLNELGKSTPELIKEILLICSNKGIRNTLHIQHDGCKIWD